MSCMDDLAAFIEARHEEEEQAASDALRAATFLTSARLPRWRQAIYDDRPNGPEMVVVEDASGCAVTLATCDNEDVTAHIAMQDPARTLARIRSERKLLHDWAAFAGILDQPQNRDDAALKRAVGRPPRLSAGVAAVNPRCSWCICPAGQRCDDEDDQLVEIDVDDGFFRVPSSAGVRGGRRVLTRS